MSKFKKNCLKCYLIKKNITNYFSNIIFKKSFFKNTLPFPLSLSQNFIEYKYLLETRYRVWSSMIDIDRERRWAMGKNLRDGADLCPVLTIIPVETAIPRPQYVLGTMSPKPTLRKVMAMSHMALRRFACSSSWNLSWQSDKRIIPTMMNTIFCFYESLISLWNAFQVK